MNGCLPKFTKSVVIETSLPELFLSRELATLEFNFRVLAHARDTSIPLLERLRYLSIVANNLDEFFEVRVAGSGHQALTLLPGSQIFSAIAEFSCIPEVELAKQPSNRYPQGHQACNGNRRIAGVDLSQR
ncbi:hypothetical protein DWU99_03805 [Dyella psychrodurans]|uniref:Polyphosphate kinase N-terminal domain-containing protein n=1 Tax=Dyella psychrodurans TaxID=1927960 RepID=A0A370XDC1_9GAMM|nr:hypothetical protein [Dyella psychrodurans]RDS86389.1 hypothetical protein DWU99_03805 [Dyella psychrodurans]